MKKPNEKGEVMEEVKCPSFLLDVERVRAHGREHENDDMQSELVCALFDSNHNVFFTFLKWKNVPLVSRHLFELVDRHLFIAIYL